MATCKCNVKEQTAFNKPALKSTLFWECNYTLFDCELNSSTFSRGSSLFVLEHFSPVCPAHFAPILLPKRVFHRLNIDLQLLKPRFD